MSMKSLVAVFLLPFVFGVQAQNVPSAEPRVPMLDRAQRDHRGPPQEAVAACQSKARDSVCSFVNREGRALTGVCFAPPGMSMLVACR